MRFEVEKARCVIRVYREGLLATVGHDLLLEAKDFRIAIKDDLSVEAECGTDRIEVAGAVRRGAVDPLALSSGDLKQIKSDMQSKVLEVHRHPKATFRSTSVIESGDRYRVHGILFLHGVERHVVVVAKKVGGAVVAELSVRQPNFGIVPFRAMLGALKIKPDVTVEVTVPVGR